MGALLSWQLQDKESWVTTIIGNKTQIKRKKFHRIALDTNPHNLPMG